MMEVSGRLDVVGHIGNQFCFKPLILHGLFHRRLQAIPHRIDTAGHFCVFPLQGTGIDFIVQLSGGDFSKSFLDRLSAADSFTR